MKVIDIVKYLNSEFPQRKAEEWDRVGLQTGNGKQQIAKVMVVLDVTKEIVDYAIKERIEMIITHHPFLFEESLEENVVNAPYKKELHERLVNTGTIVFAMHTNYDNNKHGMSDVITKKIGFAKWDSIPGSNFGAMIEHKTDYARVIGILKTKLGITPIQTNVDNDHMNVEKFVIFPGSCDVVDVLQAKRAGADLVISSDIKWSTWITASEMDINLVQITHEIEKVFTEDIAKKLTKKFSQEIDVIDWMERDNA